MRRNPPYRYLINTSPTHLEVHDLDNEKIGPMQCQIDEIINAGNAKLLNSVNTDAELANWLRLNPSYDGCRYCLPQYDRK